ncbi:alpha/beta hydrolase [Clostridium thermarum]|uniref:alpha/beta hydrolase n=1 Tax=Clostridium thermarum TaxID=1716543 RepID=UPI0013D27CCF|nr:alpha/beta hydrolase-fold protein [Clostridium thermarum]
MAIVDVNFYSNALSRQVTYKAVIPTDGPLYPGMEIKGLKSFKTVYLLHGIMGNYTDWVTCSRVAQLAAQYNVALIMPSGDNSFYVDQEAARNFYGEYIGRELVEETRKLFHLSHRREDTFIAGLSMGGYGAIRNGLKYHATFGAIAGLSSALIIEQALTSTEDAQWHFARRSYFEAVFGDLTKLKGSDKDLETLIRKIKEEKAPMPRIYLACGTEDFLIENNRKFRDFLVSEDVEHTYVESSGIHDWKFWDEYIEKVLAWLTD